jgi:hypothetical protein
MLATHSSGDAPDRPIRVPTPTPTAAASHSGKDQRTVLGPVLAAPLLEIAYAGDLLCLAVLVIEVTNDLKNRHNLTVVDELPNRRQTRHDPRDHTLDLLGDRQASLLTPHLPSVEDRTRWIRSSTSTCRLAIAGEAHPSGELRREDRLTPESEVDVLRGLHRLRSVNAKL